MWTSFGVSLLLLLVGYVGSIWHISRFKQLNPAAAAKAATPAPGAAATVTTAAVTAPAAVGATAVGATVKGAAAGATGAAAGAPAGSSLATSNNSFKSRTMSLQHHLISFLSRNHTKEQQVQQGRVAAPVPTTAASVPAAAAARPIDQASLDLPCAVLNECDSDSSSAFCMPPSEKVSQEQGMTTARANSSSSSRASSGDMETCEYHETPFAMADLWHLGYGCSSARSSLQQDSVDLTATVEGEQCSKGPAGAAGSEALAGLHSSLSGRLSSTTTLPSKPLPAARSGGDSGRGRISPYLYAEFAVMVILFLGTTVVVFQCHRYIKLGMLALVALLYFALHISLAWEAMRKKNSAAGPLCRPATVVACVPKPGSTTQAARSVLLPLPNV